MSRTIIDAAGQRAIKGRPPLSIPRSSDRINNHLTLLSEHQRLEYELRERYGVRTYATIKRCPQCRTNNTKRGRDNICMACRLKSIIASGTIGEPLHPTPLGRVSPLPAEVLLLAEQAKEEAMARNGLVWGDDEVVQSPQGLAGGDARESAGHLQWYSTPDVGDLDDEDEFWQDGVEVEQSEEAA